MAKDYSYLHIQFPTKGMCGLWNDEFRGQFSDGYWENSPQNRGYRESYSKEWWRVIAVTSGKIDLPSTPCPYSLPAYIKTVTSWINTSDTWPYRMIAYYYAAEFEIDTWRSDIDIMMSIVCGGRHHLLKSKEDFLKKMNSKEKKLYNFLLTLDLKTEWKKIIKVTNQMQKILKAYYK